MSATYSRLGIARSRFSNARCRRVALLARQPHQGPATRFSQSAAPQLAELFRRMSSFCQLRRRGAEELAMGPPGYRSWAAGERDAAIPSMPTLSRRASLRKPLDVNFKRCNFARRRARPNLARRISLPVCNESARLCMTVCAARRSQITRVKFIPKASRNQQSIIPQIPTWRWICPKH
jgi:hypothetical protein